MTNLEFKVYYYCMVKFSFDGKNLNISNNNRDYALFNTINSALKTKFHCRWNQATKSWVTSPFKLDELIEYFEELDTIEDTVDREQMASLTEGTPEQEILKTRRIPDYSLLNFPPMKGKHPYENFQHLGILTGITRSRYFYAWDMGSGKSYVASAIIAHRLLKYKDCSKVLFLTTSIGVKNLYHELFKFIVGLDPSKVAIGDKNNREPFVDGVDIVIASYNSFRLISDHYKKKAKLTANRPKKPWIPFKKWSNGGELMMILDESHEVAHSESQRSYAVAVHSSLFKYRYLFSGTPADKPEKMYNQFFIEDPWLVYNLTFSQWREKHADLGNRFSQTAINSWKEKELKKQSERFLKLHGNYYKTSDLIDLPNYNEKKIYLSMSKEQRDIYEAVVTQDISSYGETRDIINRFPYMMLAVDNPFLLEKHLDKFDDDLQNKIKTFKESSMEKYLAIDDIIEDHPNEKGIIWAIHPKSIELLAKRYAKMKPICITGDIPQEERFELVNQFKTGDHKLLIANITTLNTSATITEATYQIYVERGFTYTQYEQATRRIYRAGQDKDVKSYILIYDESLDVMLDKNLSSKGLLVEGLMKKDFLTGKQWITLFNAKESDNLDF